MDKKNLIEIIRQKLEEDLKVLAEAARATYEAATHEESKPENEYDTRGLEASYLAGAQSKRVAEIEELIFICKNMEVRSFAKDDPIATSALVELSLDGKKIFVFIMPKGGGMTISYENKNIQIITSSSPLGVSLLQLKVGDVAVVETNKEVKEYEVLSVQ